MIGESGWIRLAWNSKKWRNLAKSITKSSHFIKVGQSVNWAHIRSSGIKQSKFSIWLLKTCTSSPHDTSVKHTLRHRWAKYEDRLLHYGKWYRVDWYVYRHFTVPCYLHQR